MATKRGSAKVSAEKNKFQKMRDNLNQKFSELTSLVNQRKLDLDRKIDDLELEYSNKNKQIEKDKQTMKGLREMTEQKIDQNTLMDVQYSITKEISDKIQKLDSESKSQLKLTLTLNWNFANIKQEIDRIDLKLAIPNEPHISSPFRGDPTGFEANFNPSINYQIPVAYHVSHTLPGSGIRSDLSSLNKKGHETTQSIVMAEPARGNSARTFTSVNFLQDCSIHDEAEGVSCPFCHKHFDQTDTGIHRTRHVTRCMENAKKHSK